MFESVETLIEEHKAVQEELSDPAVHADAGRAKRVNRRYAELRDRRGLRAWVQAAGDLGGRAEFAKEDEAFAAEVPTLEGGSSDRRRRSCGGCSFRATPTTPAT